MKKRLIAKGQNGFLVTPNGVGRDYTVYDTREMLPEGYNQSDEERHNQQSQRGGQYIRQNTNKVAKVIGEIGLAASGLFSAPSDLVMAYNIIRHPVANTKRVLDFGKQIGWFIKNPRAVKIYHGNKYGFKFDLKDAKIGSENNIGLHVSPDKSMAHQFDPTGNSTMSAWIPRHNMETIDIGANDVHLFSNNPIHYSRTNGQYQTGDVIGVPKWYRSTRNDNYKFNLMKKHNGNPSKIADENGYTKLFLDNDIDFNLRQETWPDMPEYVQNQFDRLANLSERYNGKRPDKLEKINQLAARIASKNGKKVIKYHNSNPFEGDGTAYIITNPSVFHYAPKVDTRWFYPLRQSVTLPLINNIQ